MKSEQEEKKGEPHDEEMDTKTVKNVLEELT